ncbi:YwmB family TATA-box binding protein [Halalkalibacter urbisdiaboli]|uniref:YwmB family TATA-box binding protein n=1 Tax=Halalkalibacter urbisdiaboli TaxID=1960589 RepID=UPI000B44CB26|nr:YwmB family TATA-box binding protein [Halalkalibacter urbisdiaboli]
MKKKRLSRSLHRMMSERHWSNDQTNNVQMARRQENGMGSRTTATIGTPIITTEY